MATSKQYNTEIGNKRHESALKGAETRKLNASIKAAKMDALDAYVTEVDAEDHLVEIFAIVPCPRCHAPHMPHHACPSCGFYNGRLVLEVKDKESKKKA